jgi:glycolate oxidase iron-sulfur subunit
MVDKIDKEEAKIQIKNAKEEIQDLVSKCNKCGLCKALDPIYAALKDESQSARGSAILLEKAKITKQFFNTTLDGSCKHSCPFNIDLDNAIRKARKVLNLKGQSPEFNKKILKNIREERNPFDD